jgi:hypothetical protein
MGRLLSGVAIGALVAGINPTIGGSGGWKTGGVISDDGTLGARSDTYNFWTLEVGSDEWEPALKAGITCNASDIDLFYGGDPHPWGQCGTYDVAICETNSAVRAIVCMGYVWIRDGLNIGTVNEWRRSNLPQKDGCQPNETARMTGKPLAFDPENPNVLVFFAPDGVHYTHNALAATPTWVSIPTSTIPAPAAGRRGCVAFDRSSSLVSGRTQRIYFFSNGSGMYRANAGLAGAINPVASVPSPATGASHMKVDDAGYVYLTGGGDGETFSAFRRYHHTDGWFTHPNVQAKTVAISRIHPGRIWACGMYGGLNYSPDRGTTFELDNANGIIAVRQATNIGWHAYATYGAASASGDTVGDPTRDRLWTFQGIGIEYTDNPPTEMDYGQTYPSIEFSKGEESLVSSLLCVTSNGTIGYSAHDRGCFGIPKSDLGKRWPSEYGPSPGFVHGTQVDWPRSNPNFLVGCNHLGGGYTCWSDNSGRNWNRSETSIADVSGGNGGGNIVALTEDIWLTAQTNRHTPISAPEATQKNGIWRTPNRGKDWFLCTLGTNTHFDFHASYGFSKRSVVGCKYTDGKAFAYNSSDGSGSAGDLAQRGIWRTDNYGEPGSWYRVRDGYIIGWGADYFRGKFTQLGDGVWLWCAGDSGPGLYISRDDMETWAPLAGTDDINGVSGFGEVYGVAVGKNHPDSEYKTIVAAGYRMVTPGEASSITGYGFWESRDEGNEWRRLFQFPDGNFDCVLDMAGDPTEYGLIHIGFGGSGPQMIRYVDERAQA